LEKYNLASYITNYSWDSLRAIKAWALASVKTFEKSHFWRNVSTIPLSHVIHQLKIIKKKKNFKKKKS
jgi:hypothetical protein